MTPLRIFCDHRFNPPALSQLVEGLAPHLLVMARRTVSSVLARAEADPGLAAADIAFGQPGLEALKGAPRLRWVHVSSAGYTRFDTDAFRAWARGRGMPLTTSSQVYAQACAEHVFAFLLAQSRSLPAALASRAPHGSPDWLRRRAAPRTPRGERVLLLGYGTIAEHLIPLLRAFDMRIVALRRHPRGDEAVPVVTPADLGSALAGADHVISLLPDNASTRGFINRERLAAMKPGAVFYNIGRGTTVDQEALAEALHAGHLRAAWLDVTDPEPLPDGHPLWEAPNCHLTPHLAGGHHTEEEHLVAHFLDNFRRHLAGEPLLDRVV
ncbi:MAG: D-2-hydroxyacid dehydrogenase [Verrucomicrobiota bacterium]